MTEAVHELAHRAPKSGPWIIGYALSIGLVSAGSALGYVTSTRTALPFWIPIIVCTVMIVYTSWRRHRMLGSLSPAVRTFWVRMVSSASFMFASYCLLAFGQMVANWSERALAFVALLPFLGFAGMIASVHRYAADETDEYLRAFAIRQIVIASFVALIGAVLWSALETAGIASRGSIGNVILLWFAGLGIGRLCNEMRP